jgi:hypothetical protein
MKLRHARHLLPSVPIARSAPFGAACFARFGAQSLRDAADFVCECDDKPGPTPDDPRSTLLHATGTVGAKQGLLAALAAESGGEDIQLIVAFCEMRLPEMRADRADSPLRRPKTLPLAVCWLRSQDRRLQIGASSGPEFRVVEPLSETVVDPPELPAQRVRLYESFAADWCRALEISPREFARLRAWQLRVMAGSPLFEDLLGFSLPPDYRPVI